MVEWLLAPGVTTTILKDADLVTKLFQAIELGLFGDYVSKKKIKNNAVEISTNQFTLFFLLIR